MTNIEKISIKNVFYMKTHANCVLGDFISIFFPYILYFILTIAHACDCIYYSQLKLRAKIIACLL